MLTMQVTHWVPTDIMCTGGNDQLTSRYIGKLVNVLSHVMVTKPSGHISSSLSNIFLDIYTCLIG